MNFNLLVGTGGNPKLTIFLKLVFFSHMFRKNNINYIIPEFFLMNIQLKRIIQDDSAFWNANGYF